MKSTHIVVGGDIGSEEFDELIRRLDGRTQQRDLTIQEGLFLAKPSPPMDSALVEWLNDRNLPFVRESFNGSSYVPTHIYQPQYHDEPQAVTDDLTLSPEAVDSLSERLKGQLKQVLKDKLPESSNGIWEALRGQIENLDDIIGDALNTRNVDEKLPPLTLNGRPVTESILAERRRELTKQNRNQETL